MKTYCWLVRIGDEPPFNVWSMHREVQPSGAVTFYDVKKVGDALQAHTHKFAFHAPHWSIELVERATCARIIGKKAF